MPEVLSLTTQKELCLQIENVIFRLLVHKPKNRAPGSDGSTQKFYTTMHTHVSTELFVCRSGEMTLRIPSGFITLKAGDAAVIPPGIQHFTYSKSEDICSCTISFICHKKSTRCEADVYKILSPFIIGRQIIVYRSSPELYDGVEKIVKEATNDKILPVLHTIELLIKAAGMPCQRIEPSEDGIPENPTGTDIQRMMKLDQIINVFFMRDLTVEEVARHLFISPRQLDRVVKKRYGKTLRRVIIEKRLRSAEQMLISTDMTAESIGAALGFGSKPSFYREFLKEYGITPSEYRKKHK